MKRPDADIIRRALKGGRLVMGDTTKLGEVIKLGLDLPLMSFTGKDFKDTEIYAISERGKYDNPAFSSEPVFGEWVIHYEQTMTLETRDQRRWRDRNINSLSPRRVEHGVDRKEMESKVWACFLDPMHPFLKTLENYPQSIDEYMEGWRLRAGQVRKPMVRETLKFVTMILEYEGEPLTYVWQGWTAMNEDKHVIAMNTEGAEAFWEDQIEGLTQWALNTTLHGFSVWAYCKYGDKHVVEVTPTPDKLAKAKRNPANRKRPWNKASGPHVLLLDRMPTEKTESTGTHASPKPHRRRGHWKTLSHPRFRHHPQYQKKIYVKPSFVGERQVTYEGNIYRLVEPLEEIA